MRKILQADDAARRGVLNRLRRAEGQLRGIQRMVEAGESSVKVVQQISAVRKALGHTHVHIAMNQFEQQIKAGIDPNSSVQSELTELLRGMERLMTRMV